MANLYAVGIGSYIGVNLNIVSGWTQIPGDWISICSGESHSLGIKNDGTLWGIGGGLSLGLGNNLSFSSWVLIGSNWKQVFSQNFHSLAIKTDGSLS